MGFPRAAEPSSLWGCTIQPGWRVVLGMGQPARVSGFVWGPFPKRGHWVFTHMGIFMSC